MLGGPWGSILRRPATGARPLALVAEAFGVASLVLVEGDLSFLGFGGPPAANWGESLAQAHRRALSPGAWWLAVVPGAALLAGVLACNLAGEGLRDALDPRRRR